MTRHNDTIKPYFLVTFLVGMLVLTSLIFAPFLKPLVLAMVFAVVLQELYKRIARLLPGWPSTAAGITVVISIFLIVLPLAFIGFMVGNQAHSLYVSLESGSEGGLITDTLARLGVTFNGAISSVQVLSYDIPINVGTYVKNILQWVASHATDIFSSITSFLLSLFIFFIALYYLLRDGTRARDAIATLMPFNDRENKKIFDRLELAVDSVIKGNLVIAVIQGALTALGLMFTGVPNSILWGTVAAISALMPGLGAGLVAIPAVLYLFLIGAVPHAIVLAVWSIFVVGLVDNFLRPKLVGDGMQLHPLLALLSVIGGIIFFGPVGIFLGPLALSLLFALISIYSDIVREH